MKGADAEDEFEFICPHCKENWLKDPAQCEIIPIGISLRNHEASNNDLPKELAAKYDAQPTVWEAIINWNNPQSKKSVKPTNCMVKCVKCKKIIDMNKRAKNNDLKKILKKHYKDCCIW